MRVTTWNVNGLRAAIKKGFGDHLAQIAPDVLMLQEIRTLPEQLPEGWQSPVGWHVHWHPAKKKGYAGTAIFSRFPFELQGTGINGGRDPDGRVIHVRIRDAHFVCVYLPSGSASEERQKSKEKWMAKFQPWLDSLIKTRQPVIVGGDLNIAHTENDIFYVSGNRKTSGFLPRECEWFGKTLAQGWSDLVREHFGDIKGPYSWWSNRGKARELDRGWRIDYLLGNASARRKLIDAVIHRPGGMSVSDHAPVTVNLRS